MPLLSDMTAALAYVGPGLGLGAITFVLGVLLSVLLAIVGVVWYPIKRTIRALRRSREGHREPTENEPSL